jgi:hypothetical protein
LYSPINRHNGELQTQSPRDLRASSFRKPFARYIKLYRALSCDPSTHTYSQRLIELEHLSSLLEPNSPSSKLTMDQPGTGEQPPSFVSQCHVGPTTDKTVFFGPGAHHFDPQRVGEGTIEFACNGSEESERKGMFPFVSCLVLLEGEAHWLLCALLDKVNHASTSLHCFT